MKKLACVFIALIMTAMLAACGSSSRSYAASSTAPARAAAPAAAAPQMSGKTGGFAMESAVMADEMEMDDEPDDYWDGNAVTGGGDGGDMPYTGGGDGGGIAGPTVSPVVDSRKIIKNVNLEMQTMAFDEGVDAITKIAEGSGGFVQDSYVMGRDMYNERGTRHASFTIRIPSEKLDGFVDSVGGNFNVISKSQNSQDVTEAYFDSKARLGALKIQEERLLEMLSGATELEYMLQVEEKLMNVRYEIESLTASLNRLDSYISMSTVYISLYEVVKYEELLDVPVTFGERISRAFTQSLESFSELSKDAVVTIVFLLPLLIFLSVVAIIIVIIVRKNKKRRADKADKPAARKVSVKLATPPTEPQDKE